MLAPVPPPPPPGSPPPPAYLAAEVALAALRTWLALPGSDVEKALKRAMRTRHSDLDQAVRQSVAACVLGTAVFRGRLQHLLEREFGTSVGLDARLLLGLFVARECCGSGAVSLCNPTRGIVGMDMINAIASGATKVEEVVAAAARAPFFLSRRAANGGTAPFGRLVFTGMASCAVDHRAGWGDSLRVGSRDVHACPCYVAC